MTQWFRYLGVLILILILTGLDSAFFPALGTPFTFINMTLTVSLFVLIIFKTDLAIIIYCASSLLIGLSSGNYLLSSLILGIITLSLVDWLFESFFTNRSYYSLIASGIIGWGIYYVLFGLFMITSYLIGSEVITSINPDVGRGLIYSLVTVILFLSASYLSVSFMSRRIKSYFIVSND